MLKVACISFLQSKVLTYLLPLYPYVTPCFNPSNFIPKKSSLRTHIRNSHPNHDLAEVEARSIIAPSGGEENTDQLALPSLIQNQNVAQNLLSILSMANGEASNVSNSESVSEANDEPESSDEKMTEVSPEESNRIEIRNISNDKGEESKFNELMYNS